MRNSSLFSPLAVGALQLQHRIVMAPLTRMRATQPGNIPGEMNARYYAQRATAGGLLHYGSDSDLTDRAGLSRQARHSLIGTGSRIRGWGSSSVEEGTLGASHRSSFVIRTTPTLCFAGQPVLLANSDLIDKLGVAVFLSIPFRPPIIGSLGRRFRFLPEPGGAPARDPRSPPSTRRSAALRQATKTDTA
jgi:hypothetical protein